MLPRQEAILMRTSLGLNNWYSDPLIWTNVSTATTVARLQFKSVCENRSASANKYWNRELDDKFSAQHALILILNGTRIQSDTIAVSGNLHKQRTLVDARSCVRPTNDVAFGIYIDTHAWIHCQRWSWYFQHWPAAFKTSCEASTQEPPAVLVLRRCPHTCERRDQHSAHRAWDANFIHVISYEQLLRIFYAMLCMQYIDAVTWYYH